jgi:hypothetical protein
MKKPSPKFWPSSLRQLMIAVALMGVALGFPAGILNSIEIRLKNASRHAISFMEINELRNETALVKGRNHPEVMVLTCRARYHFVMMRKWEKAASYPWFVAPDPPLPQ